MALKKKKIGSFIINNAMTCLRFLQDRSWVRDHFKEQLNTRQTSTSSPAPPERTVEAHFCSPGIYPPLHPDNSWSPRLSIRFCGCFHLLNLYNCSLCLERDPETFPKHPFPSLTNLPMLLLRHSPLPISKRAPPPHLRLTLFMCLFFCALVFGLQVCLCEGVGSWRYKQL